MSTPHASCAVAAIGLAFAQRLERVRALTIEESAMLARLVAHDVARRPLRRWTSHQDGNLQMLIAEGRTAAEVGVVLGRSTQAVHTRIKRLKQHDRREPQT